MFLSALCPKFSLSFTPVLNKNRQALTLIFSSFPGFALYLGLMFRKSCSEVFRFTKLQIFFAHCKFYCMRKNIEINFKTRFKIKLYTQF